MKILCNNEKIMPGTITLTSNIDTLGDEMMFDIAYNNTKFFPNGYELNLGDIIRLIDNEGIERFRGIIIEKTKTKNNFSYTSYDYAFYLNKSDIILQLNKCSAKSAVDMVLNKCNIPTGTIQLLGECIVDEIYIGVSPSDILKEIIEKCSITEGNKYIMEMKEGKFCILKQDDLKIDCKIKIAENIAPFPTSKTLNNISLKEDMNNLKNSIQAYKEDGNNIKEIYLANDNDLIKKFGLLQETYKLETSDQPEGIANQILKERSKIEKELTADVLGSFELRAGRIINLTEKEFSISGLYIIKSVTHNISGTIHICSLTLEELM